MVSWDEQVKRDRGWNAIKKDWFDNGTVYTGKLKRCVESGDQTEMDDTCWATVQQLFPQNSN